MSSKIAEAKFNGPIAWAMPSLAQIAAKVKEVGPTSVALGAGAGGLAYLASELVQHRQDKLKREQAEKGSRDVLTVQIPNLKTAGVLDALARAWSAGGAGRAAMIGLPAAATGVGLAAAAPADMQVGARNAVQDFSDSATPAVKDAYKAVAPVLEFASDPVVNTARWAGEASVPIEADIKNTPIPTPAPEGVAPSPMWDSGMNLGIGIGGLALGYGAVKAFTNHRRSQDEKAKLEAAKAEYSDLLGQSLAGPKIATVVKYACIEGLVAGAARQLEEHYPTKFASGAMDILGAPGALAVLAGIVGHQYVYNRETAADNAMKQPRIKPPKSIRLVSAPAPRPPAPEVGDVSQTLKDEEDKVASLVNLDALDYLLKQAEPITEALQAGVVQMLPGQTTPVAEEDPASFKPRVEQIDGNTVVIHTAAGPVTVDAADPRARALLQQKSKQIASSMSAATAIPAE